ncbi:DUF2953 domain-containing protein [Paenibacillus sp. GYB003]|uniref:DUF2953 domain-containing protein n=1 Tax=Paenibacillus sp. GYB003 TaxID=2994392 RepID=UPI002F969B4E
MIWAWLIAGILVLGMLLFVFSDIAVRIRFSRKEGDDQITVDLKGALGLIRYRYAVPILYWNEDGLMVNSKAIGRSRNDLLAERKTTITREKVERFFRTTRELLAHTVELVEWTKSVLARVQCTDMRWVTRIGLGDAADTAITTGIVWGVKTSLLGFLFRHIRLETKPVLQVEPVFNSDHFSTEAVCDLKIKTAFALYALFRLTHRILRVKGGFRVWRKLFAKPST